MRVAWLAASLLSSTPAVITVAADSPIYTLGAFNNLPGNNAIYSIDPQSGDTVWIFSTQDMGVAGTPGGPMGGGHGWDEVEFGTDEAALTLSPDGSTLYTASTNAELPEYPMDMAGWQGHHALDASTGAVRWNVSGFHKPPFRLNLTRASTPFVVSGDGKSLFQSGGAGAVAYHAADGQNKWSYLIPDVWDGKLYPSAFEGLYIPPLIPVLSDKHNLLVALDGNGKLRALRAETGAMAWQFSVHGGCPVKPSILASSNPPCGWIRYTKLSDTQDTIYVVGFYSVKSREHINNTATLWALRLDDGAVKWQFPLGAYHGVDQTWGGSEPIFSGDGSVIFIKTSDETRRERLCAVNAADGGKIWDYPLPLPRDPSETPADSTPMTAGSAVYLSSDTAGLCSFDAKTGKLNWSARTGGSVDVSLSGANPDGSELYVVWETELPDNGSYLGALSSKDGSKIWSLRLGSADPNSKILSKRLSSALGAAAHKRTATTSDGSTLLLGLDSPAPGGIGPYNGGNAVRQITAINLADHTLKWERHLPAPGNQYWDGLSLDECSLCPATWHSGSHCKYGGTVVGSRRCQGTLTQCEALCKIGGEPDLLV